MLVETYGIKVIVFRDDQKILETKAYIQGNKMTFNNVDIKALDIVKVPSEDIEYQIKKINPIFQFEKLIHKEATVEII